MPGKILEKILNERLIYYLENNNKLPEQQYGFRAGRGTQVAITAIYESIALSQRNDELCTIVARDVAKAFDKVWHEGLKYKIIRENLPNCFEKILCNFLDDRSARIRIEEFIGPKFNLKSGVPQGSILSPTLYIFYTADMPPAGPGCLNIGFADDITQVITYPGKSRGMLARRITREIVKINNYEKQWKIQTSKPKFKLVSMAK